MVCSMIGGISVSVTTGLGSAIVTTAMGDNQVSALASFTAALEFDRFFSKFNYWFIYFLMAFVAVTLRKSSKFYLPMPKHPSSFFIQSQKFIISTLLWRYLILVCYITT